MDGQFADLVFTDLPYNVAYSGRGELNPLGPIQKDDMSDAAFDEFIYRAFSGCCSVMKDLASIELRNLPQISFFNGGTKCGFLPFIDRLIGTISRNKGGR